MLPQPPTASALEVEARLACPTGGDFLNHEQTICRRHWNVVRASRATNLSYAASLKNPVGAKRNPNCTWPRRVRLDEWTEQLRSYCMAWDFQAMYAITARTSPMSNRNVNAATAALSVLLLSSLGLANATCAATRSIGSAAFY